MAAAGTKRKQEGSSPAPAPAPAPKAAKTTKSTTGVKASGVQDDMQPQLALIAQSNRTAFEKRVWTALCGIPRGRVTTYGLLSAHLGSSPRAVGNALRRNPFAPDVPCHRVVATGMTLGGFKGRWPRDGEGITLDEKRSLLRGEGIWFDDKGRVLGPPWVGWT
ncbi:Methylated-DNA-protein-cysteine methyltransferase [Tolypocladium capitatum]|uniref:Methylated-DNA--protein-cysteine methyltransferase n=1 Tax=Tolypocladium capitatum TaxID=45235 RepID=A0A2K3QKW8_9HYPO|nr:Methylated-DNA-protein-cysteine methyltransferase [Tolypocladium capitatum]